MSGTPFEADYEDGAAAYMRGDYGTALKKLKPLAEQGDADAQLWMGVMYKDGQGVSQDFEEALKWLTLRCALPAYVLWKYRNRANSKFGSTADG